MHCLPAFLVIIFLCPFLVQCSAQINKQHRSNQFDNGNFQFTVSSEHRPSYIPSSPTSANLNVYPLACVQWPTGVSWLMAMYWYSGSNTGYFTANNTLLPPPAGVTGETLSEVFSEFVSTVAAYCTSNVVPGYIPPSFNGNTSLPFTYVRTLSCSGGTSCSPSSGNVLLSSPNYNPGDGIKFQMISPTNYSIINTGVLSMSTFGNMTCNNTNGNLLCGITEPSAGGVTYLNSTGILSCNNTIGPLSCNVPVQVSSLNGLQGVIQAYSSDSSVLITPTNSSYLNFKVNVSEIESGVSSITCIGPFNTCNNRGAVYINSTVPPVPEQCFTGSGTSTGREDCILVPCTPDTITTSPSDRDCIEGYDFYWAGFLNFVHEKAPSVCTQIYLNSQTPPDSSVLTPEYGHFTFSSPDSSLILTRGIATNELYLKVNTSDIDSGVASVTNSDGNLALNSSIGNILVNLNPNYFWFDSLFNGTDYYAFSGSFGPGTPRSAGSTCTYPYAPESCQNWDSFNLGYQTGQYNTGHDVNNLGQQAGQNNTGAQVNNLGYQAGQNNTGGNVNNNGQQAGQYNTGADVNNLGHQAGQNNTASFVNNPVNTNGTMSTTTVIRQVSTTLEPMSTTTVIRQVRTTLANLCQQPR